MSIQQDCIFAYELTQVKIAFCVWKAAGTYEARTSLESFSDFGSSRNQPALAVVFRSQPALAAVD